jgi:phage protein D
MARSPLSADQTLLSFTILSNGKVINDSYLIVSMDIRQQAGAQDEAVITLMALKQVMGSFELMDLTDFQMGDTVQIRLGYDAKEQTVFKGLVTQQQLHIQDTFYHYEIACRNDQARAVYVPFDILAPKESVLEVSLGMDILETHLRRSSDDPKRVLGHLVIPGCADARVNDPMDLRGMGSTFKSTETIAAVEHHVAEANWNTNVYLGEK